MVFEDGRRVRSLRVPNKDKPNPHGRIERWGIILGIVLSAMSVGISIYAAVLSRDAVVQAEKQATAAQEALTATEFNVAFQTLTATVDQFCKNLDITNGRIYVGASSEQKDGILQVFTSQPDFKLTGFNIPEYNNRVFASFIALEVAHRDFGVWAKPEEYKNLGLLFASLVMLRGPMVGTHIDSRIMIKRIGVCQYQAEQLRNWFKTRDKQPQVARLGRVELLGPLPSDNLSSTPPNEQDRTPR